MIDILFNYVLLAVVVYVFISYVMKDSNIDRQSKTWRIMTAIQNAIFCLVITYSVIYFRDDFIDKKIRKAAEIVAVNSTLYSLDKDERRTASDKYYCVMQVESDLYQFKVDSDFYRKHRVNDIVKVQMFYYDDDVYDVTLVDDTDNFRCIDDLGYRDSMFKKWRVD